MASRKSARVQILTPVQRVMRWRKKYPERYKAHMRVYVAVRNGTLKRLPCECGNPDTQCHHEDYSKPLSVLWLCRECHKTADIERRKRERGVNNSLAITTDTDTLEM